MIAEALGAGVAILGGAAHGAFHRNSPIFGRPITKARGDGKVVALTFDDGPNPDATPLILDALRDRGVKATFFILGRHAEQWPSLVKRVSDEGHTIRESRLLHRKLHFKSPAYVRRDLNWHERRPHHDDATPAIPRAARLPEPVVTAIAALPRAAARVGWSLGSSDSTVPGRRDRAAHRGRRPSRIILLLHDGDGYDPRGDRMQTARAVPSTSIGCWNRGMFRPVRP